MQKKGSTDGTSREYQEYRCTEGGRQKSHMRPSLWPLEATSGVPQ